MCYRLGVGSIVSESYPAAAYFCMAMSLKLLEKAKRRIVCGMWKLYKIEISLPINKALLEYTPFIYVL